MADGSGAITTKGLSDEELLSACWAERRQSAGLEEDADLLGDRQRALNYSKGEMPDLPALDTRSKVVSMDVSDAIETALPDLIELLAAGDDVLAFTPDGPLDEKQAEQETDYVRHVFFNENDGFQILYDFIKDALQMKVGVVTAWWEDTDPLVEDFENKTQIEVALAALSAELSDVEPGEPDDQGQPTWNFTATQKQPGKLKVAAIPPEDFTVARDAVKLKESTYSGWRARPRAQELLEEGVDRSIVDDLPAYGTTYDDTLKLARDTAGEFADMRSVTGFHDLRQVEVMTHIIRIDADGTGPKYWKVRSGNGETVLIERKLVRRVDIAAITPYRVPHRFYGESLADKLLEIQRQKTALKRMLFDSGFFALNQRSEVSMDAANAWTIPDLMRNEPMIPVRSKTGNAVRPLQSGALTFNVLEALEFSAVEGEQRTGIVRNAQGLNPDTLHDTAHGVLALIQASQKRLRLIARMFAETGLRDLYLIIHALLREHADVQRVVKLRGQQWQPISPTEWAEREAMTIEVGNGASGNAQEVQVLTELFGIQGKIVEAQAAAGNPTGPVVTPQNVFNLVDKIAQKSGERTPGAFVTDPTAAMQQMAQNPAPKQPSPEMIKAQGDEADRQQQGQLEQAKLFQGQQAEVAAHQLAEKQAETDAQERLARVALDAQNAARDDDFRREQLASQERIAMAKIAAGQQDTETKVVGGFATATTVQSMKDANDDKQREADLAIQQSESKDVAELSDKSE